MLPEFAEAGTLPAAAGFRTWLRLADEVWKMRSNKGGNGLTMTLESKAAEHLISNELEVRRFLQRHKSFKKFNGFRRPIRSMVTA